jgi:hypothetical protein
MISPPPTPARRLVRQQRLQRRPLFLSQVMTIVHRNDLPHPTQKIHRTRPSPADFMGPTWATRASANAHLVHHVIRLAHSVAT